MLTCVNIFMMAPYLFQPVFFVFYQDHFPDTSDSSALHDLYLVKPGKLNFQVGWSVLPGDFLSIDLQDLLLSLQWEEKAGGLCLGPVNHNQPLSGPAWAEVHCFLHHHIMAVVVTCPALVQTIFSLHAATVGCGSAVGFRQHLIF